MKQCLICNAVFENARKLSCHLRSSHNMSSKEYYDAHLKSPGEGICSCGKSTRFDNITRGYLPSCGVQCGNNMPSRIEKIIKTKTLKYGENWEEIYIKQQNTVANWDEHRTKDYRKKLSGSLRLARQDPSLTERIIATRAQRFTSDQWSEKCRLGHEKRTKEQIDAANEKRKETSLKKYGCSSHTQTAEYKENRSKMQSLRTKEEIEQSAKKAFETKIQLGYCLPKDHPDRESKKQYKNKARAISEYWAKVKFSESELNARGLNGVIGAVQLDHIVSLETCYRQGIPIEIAGHYVNLRIVSWQENISKKTTDGMSVTELYESFKKYFAGNE